MITLLASFLTIPIIGKIVNACTSQEQTIQTLSRILDEAQLLTKSNDLETLTQTLQSSPNLCKKLEKRWRLYEKSSQSAHAHDTMNARTRDIYKLYLSKSNKRADVMVISAALGLLLCLVVLGCLSKSLPGEIIGIISTVAGMFGSCLKDAYAFEFGSSRGSRDKDLTQRLTQNHFSEFK